MKVIGLALLLITAPIFAQVTQTSHGPNSPNIVGHGNVVTPQPAPPAAPPATVVEPKHSEATANLALAEETKLNLEIRRQLIMREANRQIIDINTQEKTQSDAAAEAIKKVKEENGWDDSYTFTPSQSLQDGTVLPAKWQKSVSPPPSPKK